MIDIKLKALMYSPSHQRVSELYLLNSINTHIEPIEQPFSIGDSLEILKNNFPELFQNLSELRVKTTNNINNTTEDLEDFIVDKLSDSETDSESEEGIEDEDSVDDDTKYESESEFSE